MGLEIEMNDVLRVHRGDGLDHAVEDPTDRPDVQSVFVFRQEGLQIGVRELHENQHPALRALALPRFYLHHVVVVREMLAVGL